MPLLKLTRPLHLLLAALTYTLGASIPAYLGKPFSAFIFWLGFVGILFAQMSMALLSEVFRPRHEPLVKDETPQQKETLRSRMLHLSIALLTVNAVLAYLLYVSQSAPIPFFLFLLLSLILILAYSVPPIRLLERGFGELALAFHLAYVIPSIGFVLQYGQYHRLLVFIIVPLTALALAYLLVLNFTTFQDDQKYQRATLLRQMTWERAVPFHHAIVVFAYTIFIISLLFGFSVLWTSLLTLPFAVLQIVLLRYISLGGKPNWKLLTANALAVFGLTAYFIAINFWLR